MLVSDLHGTKYGNSRGSSGYSRGETVNLQILQKTHKSISIIMTINKLNLFRLPSGRVSEIGVKCQGSIMNDIVDGV